MKRSDEIKKGLEHCINGTSCRGCPYCEECAIASDCNPMHKDLQEYIQQLEEFADRKIVELFGKVEQLESDKQQLEGLLTHMNQLRDAAAGRALQMEERVHQLEAERDAAVACLKKAANEKGECFGCKWHNGKNCTHPDYKMLCSSHDDKWEWRGVTKEE